MQDSDPGAPMPGNVDFETDPKDSAAQRDNFAVGREKIPDSWGDRGDACALAEGASCPIALLDSHRVCKVRVSLKTGAAPLLFHPVATAVALHLSKFYFAMGVWQSPMGEEQAVLVECNANFSKGGKPLSISLCLNY